MLYFLFARVLSRCRRRDARDDNGSQKLRHCRPPGRERAIKPVKHSYTSQWPALFHGICYTCMMSMMAVRFLSWVGPIHFRTRFIKVMLLHSIKSSSPSWPLCTCSSFNNSATCLGSLRQYCYNPTHTAVHLPLYKTSESLLWVSQLSRLFAYLVYITFNSKYVHLLLLVGQKKQYEQNIWGCGQMLCLYQ